MEPVSIEQIEEKMSWKFDKWQKELINSDDPRLIACCGRKTGKTTAIEAKIALDMMNKSFAKCDGICILSKGQRQAKEVLMGVRAILSAFGITFSKELNEEGDYGSMSLIRLSNGNKCYALPCGYDGVTIRMYSFYKMFRDEDAYIPDAVDAAVNACLAVHGVQEVRTSTPAGTAGSFYRMWFHPEFGYKRWHISSEDCTRIPKSYLRVERSRLTKSEYSQEYLAEFTEIADGIYNTQMIAACTGKEIDWDLVQKSAIATYIGADFAKFGDDKNVIAICYWDGLRAHVKVDVIHDKMRTTTMAGKITFLARKEPHFKLVITDEGGLGEGPTDILIENLGKRHVIGVKNQKIVERKFQNVHLHRNLIKLMETGKITLDDDVEIVRSLRGVKYTYGKSSKLSIGGRDTHTAEAIVRAVFPLMIKKPIRMDQYIYAVPHENETFKGDSGLIIM